MEQPRTYKSQLERMLDDEESNEKSAPTPVYRNKACDDCGEDKIPFDDFLGGTKRCPSCEAERRAKWKQTQKATGNATRIPKRKQPRTPDEDFHGMCQGGCGKRVDGERTCYQCRTKGDKELFKVKTTESELWRGNALDAELNSIEKQVVVRKGIYVSVQSLEWLWQERIPRGAITWVVGQPGNAKSLLTCDIAARASTGADWADGQKNPNGPMKVLMCCMEDPIESVVTPRLLAHGADLRNIDFLDDKSFREKHGENLHVKRSINLDQDMDALFEVVKTNKEYKVLICDPITGIFGNKSINKDQEVHPILQQLSTLCQDTGLVFIGVVHTPKLQTRSSTEKIAGGSAVAGKCRAAFMLSRDPDSEDKHDHVMTSIKTNLSGVKNGLKYKTVPAKAKDSDPNSVEVDTVKIEWVGTTEDTADDILAKQNAKPEQRDRQADKCEAFLKTFLAGGSRRSPEVYDAAKEQDFGKSTVMRALKAVGGDHVDGRRYGKQGYWMSLTPVNPFPGESSSEPEKKIAMVGEEL